MEENYYDDIDENDVEKNFHSQKWKEIEEQQKAQIREESIIKSVSLDIKSSFDEFFFQFSFIKVLIE